MRFIDLTGEQFGQWAVTGYHGVINGTTMWACRCDCGYEDLVTSGNLRRGLSTRCVKCRGKISEVGNRKHGNSTRKNGTSTEYKSWTHMKDRCLNPDNAAYCDYGGRGITVFPGWVDDFQAFLDHIGHKPSPDHSIERIDNHGNYEPGNVKWATGTEQARNRRSNLIVTIDGITGCLAHVCEQLYLDPGTIWIRMFGPRIQRSAQEAADSLREEASRLL